MPWVPPLTAAIAATVAGLATPYVLRALPEPVADPDVATKVPYRALATPGFAAAVALGTLAATGVVVALTPADEWLAWTALSMVGVLAATIDARTTWLPLPLARASWGVAALGIAAATLLRREVSPLLWAGVGALGVWLFFEVLWRVTGGIGYGDVRLMATVGAVTGAHDPALVLRAVLTGTVLGAVWGIAHRMWRGEGPFPYGPGLLAGPFVALAIPALMP